MDGTSPRSGDRGEVSGRPPSGRVTPGTTTAAPTDASDGRSQLAPRIPRRSHRGSVLRDVAKCKEGRMRRLMWVGIGIAILALWGTAIGGRVATRVPLLQRQHARVWSSPYVSPDTTLGPHPSLAAVRAKVYRFFLQSQQGHLWRITHLQQTTLGVVVKAVGSPVMTAPPTTPVYWVEATGSASREAIALLSMGRFVQRSFHRVGVVFDIVTGCLIIRYSAPT